DARRGTAGGRRGRSGGVPGDRPGVPAVERYGGAARLDRLVLRRGDARQRPGDQRGLGGELRLVLVAARAWRSGRADGAELSSDARPVARLRWPGGRVPAGAAAPG